MKSMDQFERVVEAWKLKGLEFNRFYKWYFKDRTSKTNNMERLWTGQHIAEFHFKCKYCGHVGQIYPMHYCSAIKGMRDIEGTLMRDTIDLTEEEKKECNLVHNPTLFQKISKWFSKKIISVCQSNNQ